MLQVSLMTREAVDADIRYITAKVKVYFDPNTPIIYTEDNYLIDCNTLEEAGADNSNPIGAVSANELYITLLNDDKRFTSSNTKSPLYGKLIPNIKVELVYTIQTDIELFIDIDMGTYYTNEWHADTSSSTATLICLDKLSVWGQLDMPSLKVQKNVILKDSITKVLLAVGLTSDQFIIDPQLNYLLPFVAYARVKLLKYLQDLATGYGCLIFVNRSNQLVIKYVGPLGTPVATFTDDNQILSTKIPQSTLDLYSVVALKYNRLQKSERRLLLEMTETTLSPGLNSLNDLALGSLPCIMCDAITVLNGTNVSVTSISYDSWKISLGITNGAATNAVVTIQVYGYQLDSIQAVHQAQDSGLVTDIGVKTLEIESTIIQDEAAATIYANRLLAMVSKYATRLEIEARGNPLLELGDTISVVDDTNKIQGNYLFYRSDYMYDGTVGAQITVIKVGDA